MKRRALLTTVGGTVVALAGCASSEENTPTSSGDETPTETPDDETPTDTDDRAPTETPDQTPTETPDQTPTETPDQTPTETPDDGTENGTADGSISVDLQQVEWVAGAHERWRKIDDDDVVAASNLPAVLRDALIEARDDTFETDSVSDELLAALDEQRKYGHGELRGYVEIDGRVYEFEGTAPTFVASLREPEDESYDEDRLLSDRDQDFDSEEVDSFLDTVMGKGTHVPRAEYRQSVVPDAVETFLEQYDYIEDDRGVGRIETTTENEEPPYSISVREVNDEDVWGAPVVDAADLDEEVVAFFERVLASDHRDLTLPPGNRSKLYMDEEPTAYVEFAESYADAEKRPQFVRIDGAVYAIGAGQPRYDRIPVAVSLEEADEDRQFTITITPEPDNADAEVEGGYTFTSQGALPSVLWVTHDDHRHLLESPAYDKSRWYDAPEDPNRDVRPTNEALEPVKVHEEISATYTVPEGLPAGTYVSRGSFRLSWGIPGQTPGEGGTYPFEVEITVEE